MAEVTSSHHEDHTFQYLRIAILPVIYRINPVSRFSGTRKTAFYRAFSLTLKSTSTFGSDGEGVVIRASSNLISSKNPS